MDERLFTTAVGKYLINPIVKAAIALRLAPPSYAIGPRFNGAVVQIMGTELLTVRIDLDPSAARRRFVVLGLGRGVMDGHVGSIGEHSRRKWRTAVLLPAVA